MGFGLYFVLELVICPGASARLGAGYDMESFSEAEEHDRALGHQPGQARLVFLLSLL